MSDFKEYRINKVIAIDDVFNQSFTRETKIIDIPETIIERISNIYEEETGEMDSTLKNFYSNTEVDQVLKDYFDSIDFSDEEIEDYLNEMNSDEKNNYQTLLENKTFDFIKWKVEPQSELFDNIKRLEKEEDKILIILDKNLTLSKENPTVILSEVLREINNQLTKNKNLFLVLFSTDPEELPDYNSVFDYLNDSSGLNLEKDIANNLALHINFVDKNNYDINHFISSLRKSQKANYVNSFDEIYEKCIISLKKRIWDMSHNEALLNYDYLMEGQHVDNIIYDMFTNKFNHTYNEFRKDNYDEIINPIRNSMQKYENYRVPSEEYLIEYIPERFRLLKEINYYVNSQGDELKCSKSDDISYGDIIEIGESKYVVISQNCDITIRSNGKRILDSFNLMKITETEENIDAEWLAKFYNEFFRIITTKESAENKKERRKVFSNLFYDNQNESEIQKMGFESKYLEKIEEANMSLSSKLEKKLNKIEFDNPRILSTRKKYDIDTYQIYTVPCFWLDVLLLRKEDDSIDDVIVTKKLIEDSKEIRLATKKNIESKFNEMLEKYSEIPRNILETSLKSNFFNPIMPIEALWKSEGDELDGFLLREVKRERCLTQYEVKRLHKKILDVQTREAINLEIPI